MQKQWVHRLYTEDINRQAITDILAKHFDAFTLIPAIGCWDNLAEQSIIIEVTGVSFADVSRAALAIKEANKQQAVLYTGHECKTRLF